MNLLQSEYYQDLQELIHEVKLRTYNEYAQEFVTYPSFDILQLHFSFLFLTSMKCSEDLKKSICMSQLMIQMGLDSHELTDNRELHEEREIKSRQLTVLSGDYFSSHYYLLLAEKNKIELINKWAHVIKEINEMKADYHVNSEEHSTADRLEAQLKIKGKLGQAVLDWYNANSNWQTLYEKFTYLFHFSETALAKNNLDSVLSELEDSLVGLGDISVEQELRLWVHFFKEQLFALEP